jgi:hypothetical protein
MLTQTENTPWAKYIRCWKLCWGNILQKLNKSASLKTSLYFSCEERTTASSCRLGDKSSNSEPKRFWKNYVTWGLVKILTMQELWTSCEIASNTTEAGMVQYIHFCTDHNKRSSWSFSWKSACKTELISARMLSHLCTSLRYGNLLPVTLNSGHLNANWSPWEKLPSKSINCLKEHPLSGFSVMQISISEQS